MKSAVVYDRDAAELRGWLYDENDPRTSHVVEILIGGIRAARVDATLPSMGWAGPSLDASFNGFQYRIPTGLLNGDRINLIDIVTATGQPLEGSPILIEQPLPVAGLQPQFLLADRHPTVIGVNTGFASAGDQILFESPEAFASPSGTLTQNAPAVGGLWGHRAYPPWRPYLAKLKDVFVDPEHGNIYNRDGELWSGCHYLRNTDAIREARERIKNEPAGIPYVPGETLVFSESVGRNYWHWHTDCLPILYQARRLLPIDELTFLTPVLDDWRRQGAEAVLGRPLPDAPFGLTRVDAVYASSYLDGRSIYPDSGVVGTFRTIRTALAPEPQSGVRPERIFISRMDASDRVLQNEDELFAALQPFGFERLLLTNVGYAEKIALFANARIVVGCHGAGLTNVGFCRPGTNVVEIVAASRAIGAIRLLSARLGLDHHWYSTSDEEAQRLNVSAFISDFQRQVPL